MTSRLLHAVCQPHLLISYFLVSCCSCLAGSQGQVGDKQTNKQTNNNKRMGISGLLPFLKGKTKSGQLPTDSRMKRAHLTDLAGLKVAVDGYCWCVLRFSFFLSFFVCLFCFFVSLFLFCFVCFVLFVCLFVCLFLFVCFKVAACG